jgi:hypothetical protein
VKSRGVLSGHGKWIGYYVSGRLERRFAAPSLIAVVFLAANAEFKGL